MKTVRHPSMRRLQRWLDGGEDQLDKHLALCEKCAERIESLENQESALKPALITLLSPDDGVAARLRGGIDDRMRSSEDLALISELFGLPIRAARVMTTTGQGET